MQIESCDICQRKNHKLQKTSCSLHPIPVKSEVWNQLGMDLIGPLKETSSGFKFIIDYYSKWVEAGPLKDKSASSVAEFLYSEKKEWPQLALNSGPPHLSSQL